MSEYQQFPIETMSAKAIGEELSFIGRYMTGISPKLQKWKDLDERKAKLRNRLKQLPDKDSGTNQEALPKKYKAGKKFIQPTSSPDFLDEHHLS